MMMTAGARRPMEKMSRCESEERERERGIDYSVVLYTKCLDRILYCTPYHSQHTRRHLDGET